MIYQGVLKIKLTVLVDNNTLIDRYFMGEPGVSYFIECDNKRILFDLGYSDLFLRNAGKMGIDLLNIDYLVLSHSHLDHTWGLQHLIEAYTGAAIEGRKYNRVKMVTHPETFTPRFLEGIDQIGSTISKERAGFHFDLNLSKEPVWLTDNLVFLGEIERKNDFEALEPIGKAVRNGVEEDDFIIEDSALAYRSSEGLFIITGCSHAGICNIIEKAKKVCRNYRVIDIIGGLHLLSPSQKQLEGTLDYMKRLNPEMVHACHCTDLQSKIALAKVVNLKEVGVGLELNLL
jgi:7,8-dihydropterin-6-yl-methyl-4-(beta-D-ribofuranosyl)aminobenzene 5'-phosphate synthase